MTGTTVAVVLACGFLCGLAAWACAATRRRRRPHLARREAAVRSALYQSFDDPEPGRILDGLGASERKLLETKARALLPTLRGEDRETLARLLESRGATRAARRQCRSRRATSRAAACRMLGDVGSSFAVLDLVPLLEDPRPAVRMAAARALGRLGQPAGVVPLMGSVSGRKALPLDVAADAIQQIRDWPVSLLHPCLADPSEPTRALAVELLGRFQALDSVGALIEILERDPSTIVRVRAARALGRIDSPHAVQSLMRCVHLGPGELRVEAVRALGRLGATAAVPTLRVTLLGPSLQLSQAAAASLSAIVPRGVEVLQEIAGDHLHPAASIARRALAAEAALAAGLLPEPSVPVG
ncbi:MAG TPA: HEAT repeat domain-containing protein [Acidimicrobiales bacterium]|nr:HEAT repeat domain-containing protein [Acidimicrobiales bacterium]